MANKSPKALPKKVAKPKKLISSWQLLKQSLKLINANRRIFAGLTIVYGILTVIFVRGFSKTVDLSGAKASLKAAKAGGGSTGLNLLGNLFGSNSSSSSASGAAYQLILFVLMSLAVIWVVRQIYAAKQPIKFQLKDAFYKSTGQITQFSLVLGYFCLQFLPAIIGLGVYTAVLNNNVANSSVERLLWSTGLIGLLFWSLYMLSATIFAVYIVTLDDVHPRQAIKSSRELVKGRRGMIMRRLLSLPLILFLAISAVMLPIVLVLTPLAEWIYFGLTLASLLVAHVYYYSLYRDLL